MNKPLIARVLLANAAAFCLLGLLLKLLGVRSEEHTSELQSQSNLVCRLMLEKKSLTRARGLYIPSACRQAVRRCCRVTSDSFTDDPSRPAKSSRCCAWRWTRSIRPGRAPDRS